MTPHSPMRAGFFTFAGAAAALALGAAFLWPANGSDRATRSADRSIVVAAAPAASQDEAASTNAFDDRQKAAIEAIIRDYLIANPEIMLEVQSALEARMESLQAEQFKAALEAHAAEVFRSPTAPVAGNPNGDIPVVEFFDYNCGYCKRAFADLAKLIEADPKVKLVMKELPILSKASEEAARVALAAQAQGRYWDVHSVLIELRGEVNERTALKAVEKLGTVDMNKLKADMASDAVTEEIRRVRELAQRMGIQGTPHFLVGDRMIPGAPGNLLEQLQGHVAELRTTGCSVC